MDLRRHRDDASIRRPGQLASWPVVGPAASAPYRAFRLLLEGPTAGAGLRGGTGGMSGVGIAAGVASHGGSASGGVDSVTRSTVGSYNFGISNIELYGYLYRLGERAAVTSICSGLTSVTNPSISLNVNPCSTTDV